jgi:hypothetical protein
MEVKDQHFYNQNQHLLSLFKQQQSEQQQHVESHLLTSPTILSYTLITTPAHQLAT